eukprot:scaffold617_cov161-Pinguiococcus_pyrenoidosus.AAC.2
MNVEKCSGASAGGCNAVAKAERRGNQNSSMIRPSSESTPCCSRSRSYCIKNLRRKWLPRHSGES